MAVSPRGGCSNEQSPPNLLAAQGDPTGEDGSWLGLAKHTDGYGTVAYPSHATQQALTRRIIKARSSSERRVIQTLTQPATKAADPR